MALEYETRYLFVIGVVLVLLLELVVMFRTLKKGSRKRMSLLGHVICVAIMFVCLGMLLFGEKTAPDGGLYNGSGLFGIFGIFWALSEVCLLSSVFFQNK